jgi:FkbM family methyltransferase
VVNSNKFEEAHLKRKLGSEKREDYWTFFREFLLELSEFSEFQFNFHNSIFLQDNQLIVEIQSSQTHTSRVKMILDPSDIRSVPFSVLAEGFYEPYQSDILINLGKMSSQFFDIGANMGFYSLAIAKENPQIKINAFEPQPLIHSLLNRNLTLNNQMNLISTHNIGLGEKSNSLTMYVPSFTGSGGASFKNLHEEEGAASTITVAVHRMDDYIHIAPDLMKMDVEGYELNVLLGAKKSINNSKPTIVVELLRKWMKPFGHTPQMFLDELKLFGYNCLAIGTSRLREIEYIDELTLETNFIFVHEERKRHWEYLKTHVD